MEILATLAAAFLFLFLLAAFFIAAHFAQIIVNYLCKWFGKSKNKA